MKTNLIIAVLIAIFSVSAQAQSSEMYIESVSQNTIYIYNHPSQAKLLAKKEGSNFIFFSGDVEVFRSEDKEYATFFNNCGVERARKPLFRKSGLKLVAMATTQEEKNTLLATKPSSEAAKTIEGDGFTVERFANKTFYHDKESEILFVVEGNTEDCFFAIKDGQPMVAKFYGKKSTTVVSYNLITNKTVAAAKPIHGVFDIALFLAAH